MCSSDLAGVVSTLAGAPRQSGFTDGTGSAARFNSPWGIAVDRSGTVFVYDNQNNAVRRISPAGVVTTLAGSATGTAGSLDGTGGAARFDQPRGLTVDASGSVFVMDYGNGTLRRVTPHDMFPQTQHVECVADLRWEGEAKPG